MDRDTQFRHTERYSATMITLHWLMAAVILAVIALMEFRGLFERGSAGRQIMASLHFMLGLSVLGLVAARLIVRLRFSPPPIVPEPPGWQTLAARVTHIGFYVLMIAMPLLGWMILSAAGKPVSFFGLTLPPLVGENKDLAKTIEGFHELGGNILLVLIGIHAAAALAHHYLLRDTMLSRMAPALARRSVADQMKS